MQAELTVQYNTLLEQIRSGKCKGNTINLLDYNLDSHLIDLLISALKKRHKRAKQKYKRLLSFITQHSTKLDFLINNATILNEVQREALLKYGEISIVFTDDPNATSLIDKHNNYKERSLFETELAHEILKFLPKTIFETINQAIQNYIIDHESIRTLMMNGYSETPDIYSALTEEGFTKNEDSATYPIELFLSLLHAIDESPARTISLYKIFFELYFDPSLLNLKNDKRSQVLPLSVLAQNCLKKNHNIHFGFFDKADPVLNPGTIFKILRPDEVFAQEKRGRAMKSEGRAINHFGITDNENLPNWAKNYHPFKIVPAKNLSIPNRSSEVVQFYEKHQMPFIAGASGTVCFVLNGVMALETLDTHQLKIFLNILAASLVALGHHSFYEVMSVASYLKFYPFIKKHKENLLSLTSKIDPENFYNVFLVDEFKSSKGYLELLNQFPHLLSAAHKRPSLS